MTDTDSQLSRPAGLDYLGLAPFLRASIAGEDLLGLAQRMLRELDQNGGDANLLMNLSTIFQCLDQQPMGLAFQQAALAITPTYTLPARVQPKRLRLLILVTPGNMQSNTPLDCLLEVSDVELVFHYVVPGSALLADAPLHDLLFVGISDSDESRPLLQALATVLKGWQAPVLNAPQHLPRTGRDSASRLLQGVPGLLAPATQRVSRSQLQALAEGQIAVSDLFLGGDFPVILRPVGSQAGLNLKKMEGTQAVAAYLADLVEDAFFIAPFIDYSDARGLFRKIRVALVGGQAFVCHVGVSSHWMIHYVNAGMYEDARKRAEEARFMDDFAQFVVRHQGALDAISQRMQLEYLVMDCAETSSGDLLLFEIDHGGVVHAMDVESLFPYKSRHIHKLQAAFCQLLYDRLP